MMNVSIIKLKKGLNKVSTTFDNILSPTTYIKYEKKKIIDNKVIDNKVVVELDVISDCEIVFKNRLETKVIKICVEEDVNKSFTISATYNKGKVDLNIKRNYDQEETLNVSIGDTNKTITFKHNERVKTVKIVKMIKGVEKITTTINGVAYDVVVIDKDKFPSGFIHTNNGVKLNKHTDYKLDVIHNNKPFELYDKIIPFGDIQVYFKGVLLCEYENSEIKKNTLKILNNPKRIVLSQIASNDIRIKTKQGEYVIKQNEKEVLLPNLKEFNILSVDGASMIKKDWIFIR